MSAHDGPSSSDKFWDLDLNQSFYAENQTESPPTAYSNPKSTKIKDAGFDVREQSIDKPGSLLGNFTASSSPASIVSQGLPRPIKYNTNKKYFTRDKLERFLDIYNLSHIKERFIDSVKINTGEDGSPTDENPKSQFAFPPSLDKNLKGIISRHFVSSKLTLRDVSVFRNPESIRELWNNPAEDPQGLASSILSCKSTKNHITDTLSSITPGHDREVSNVSNSFSQKKINPASFGDLPRVDSLESYYSESSPLQTLIKRHKVSLKLSKYFQRQNLTN